MIEWKKFFWPTTLDKGMTLYQNKRVINITEYNDKYTASVLDTKRYEVSFSIRDRKIKGTHCQCPMSKGMGLCEHVAAVLYAIENKEEDLEKQRLEEARKRAEQYKKEAEEMKNDELKKLPEEAKKKELEERRLKQEQEKAKRRAAQQKQEELEKQKRNETYQLLGGSQNDSDADDDSSLEGNIQQLENYSYFDGNKILDSLKLAPKDRKNGEAIYRQGKMNVTDISCGYDRLNGQCLGQVEANFQIGRNNFNVTLLFSHEEVTYARCECPECSRKYWGWYSDNSRCQYTAALAFYVRDYVNCNNFSDATDMNGDYLLNSYRRGQIKNSQKETPSLVSPSVTLVPRLTQNGNKLFVSFKVGTSKMFVVKKLDDFCRQVHNGETVQYGTNTQISHKMQDFTEKSRKWIRYIDQIVREEEQFVDKIQNSGIYLPKKFNVGSSLDLFGWRLDSFYDNISNDKIDFEDKTPDAARKKFQLCCKTGNPRISIRILDASKDKKQFDGVTVKGYIPELFQGMDSAYFIQDDNFCKTEPAFMAKVRPLTELSRNGEFHFQMGRNTLSNFYHNVLPQLQEVADITEENPEKFRQYLTPEAHFVFYLDMENDNVICKVSAFYGKREFSVGKLLLHDDVSPDQQFRDFPLESSVLDQTMEWLPYYDPDFDVLHCNHDEELIYQIMESGTAALMELGEVRCTNRFRSRHTLKTVKVSVGVSVSGGLLDLNISTDDISSQELLDILKSYQLKKKYYKLKSGEFVNLQEQNLEMLAELMKTLHLTPKEFVKDKMHIPAYRTLYLDQMLENNENIYANRDRHFREIVKGFKTINDADFEEPESLSKIMRKYQKNGYKWLRTLEAWKFGGILADDMGLGKTLQVIAVLLAAKLEGKTGTSLVVAPAALVFNWGEELARFAPELKTSLITGSQAERQVKLQSYKDFDVLVTSYDLLKRDIDQYEEKELLYQIIDEAQYIKNHTTAAAKAVKVVHSQTRYALTGTPIENRLSELWSIFDYLMPGFLYGYDTFKKEFETPIVKNNDDAAMTRLQKMVGPFILRRLKSDVLKDLPEKLEEIRYVKFEDAQQKLYDAQVTRMKEKIAQQDDGEFNKNKLWILAELTKLRQICCSPTLCFENYRGESAKADSCMQLIQSAIDAGHRMLLFSQFTSMLAILQAELEKEEIPYYIITGETSKQKRQELVKKFNGDTTPVFLISLKAGGVGLNLTGADVVIHYDPWWNQAVQNQATDRAHRIGQTKKVTVYKLIARNTIEEKIQKLQETKQDLAEQIINGDMGQLGSMSREDILELL